MVSEVSKSLVRLGNSEAIIIPKRMLEQLRIGQNDRVTLTVEGDGIVARKASVLTQASAHNLTELFAHYHSDFMPHEVDWGKAVGKEEIH